MAFILKVISLTLIMNREFIVGQSNSATMRRASGSIIVKDAPSENVESFRESGSERTVSVESKNSDVNTFRDGIRGRIWQVDRTGSQDTANANRHPNVKVEFEKNEDDFHIDRSAVKYEDLRNPLYSITSATPKCSTVNSTIPPSPQTTRPAKNRKKYDYTRLRRPLSCGQGRKIFIQKGAQCHSVGVGGRHKQGPNLSGLCGRDAGQSPGYSYTQVIKDKGITWNEFTLDRFLQNPKKMIPGTKMVFAGFKKKRDRQHLIYYLCHCI